MLRRFGVWHGWLLILIGYLLTRIVETKCSSSGQPFHLVCIPLDNRLHGRAMTACLKAAGMRARPGGAAFATPGRRASYRAKGVSGPAAAEIASFCSVAAGGCPVASCNCWSRSRLTRCKPAITLARDAGSSGITAHAAHSSNSGESRLAVRRPIASCIELATVRPSSLAGSGDGPVRGILRARGRQRRPPGVFVMSSFGRSGSARRLGPVPVPGPRWPGSARAARGQRERGGACPQQLAADPAEWFGRPE